MMLSFTPCHAEHLRFIKPHPAQAHEFGPLLAGDFASIVKASTALTGWAEGRCLGVAGVLPLWEGRAEAWGFLSAYAGGYAAGIVKRIRFVLARVPQRRIELVVSPGNLYGARLARALGFEHEGRLRAYLPDGSDVEMYSRVRG